ncbi:MAG: proline--tRNA ligase [Rickettsiaceae bacterium]|nr:proline--tRNA ligase [Rickettsiaceae bacterium]
MRLSQLFLPLIKEIPSEAHIASHVLMLRSGMIRQAVSGIYSWLPLGQIVLENIQKIIRKHLNNIGCQELIMPCIQPAHIWHESGRFNAYGPEMLKIKDRSEHDLLFSPTNEELITDIFRSSVKTYKELPKILYQIQWKFRDEIRPRFGVMRGREFLMKDSYSFDLTKEDALRSYNLIFEAYCNIFKEIGLNFVAVKADSGPIGGDLNHEFHVIAETGESAIYFDEKYEELLSSEKLDISKIQNLYARTDETIEDKDSSIEGINIKQKRGIEVGHAFYFGTKYSKSMNASVNDNAGASIHLEMGSYGIGVSRLVGAIIETNHDEKGIIWPLSVAPFEISVINLGVNDDKCSAESRRIYDTLNSLGVKVLLDDTDKSPGNKFAINDLIGVPYQVIIGKKNIETNIVEMKNRRTGTIEQIDVSRIFDYILKLLNR